MTGTVTAPTFDEWCIVELMGHRKVAARVREVTIAGQGFLRLDEPATPRSDARTQLVNPASVYALHPTTEDVVRTMAIQWASQPVSRWEYKAAEARALETTNPTPALAPPDPDEQAAITTYTNDPAMRDDQADYEHPF